MKQTPSFKRQQPLKGIQRLPNLYLYVCDMQGPRDINSSAMSLAFKSGRCALEANPSMPASSFSTYKVCGWKDWDTQGLSTIVYSRAPERTHLLKHTAQGIVAFRVEIVSAQVKSNKQPALHMLDVFVVHTWKWFPQILGLGGQNTTTVEGLRYLRIEIVALEQTEKSRDRNSSLPALYNTGRKSSQNKNFFSLMMLRKAKLESRAGLRKTCANPNNWSNGNTKVDFLEFAGPWSLVPGPCWMGQAAICSREQLQAQRGTRMLHSLLRMFPQLLHRNKLCDAGNLPLQQHTELTLLLLLVA